MTSESVTQNLEQWAESHLQKLFEFSPQYDDADFDASFQHLFTPESRIILDHKHVSLDDFKAEVESRKAAVTSAKVAFKEIMARPKDDDSEGDLIAGSLVVTRFSKIRIRAAAMQMTATVFFSMSVDHSQDGKQRRIKEIYLTQFDKTVPFQSLSSTGT